MKDHGECVQRDERRRRLNLKSKEWADRDGKRWTDDEELYVVDHWILLPPGVRDEVGVSKHLHRSLFACQRKAEDLREVLDCQGAKHPKNKDEPEPVCKTCFTVLPKTGQCDNCE